MKAGGTSATKGGGKLIENAYKPHLHFEITIGNGTKRHITSIYTDPLRWFNTSNIRVNTKFDARHKRINEATRAQMRPI